MNGAPLLLELLSHSRACRIIDEMPARVRSGRRAPSHRLLLSRSTRGRAAASSATGSQTDSLSYHPAANPMDRQNGTSAEPRLPWFCLSAPRRVGWTQGKACPRTALAILFMPEARCSALRSPYIQVYPGQPSRLAGARGDFQRKGSAYVQISAASRKNNRVRRTRQGFDQR